jgi:hypothetical protein
MSGGGAMFTSSFQGFIPPQVEKSMHASGWPIEHMPPVGAQHVDDAVFARVAEAITNSNKQPAGWSMLQAKPFGTRAAHMRTHTNTYRAV